MNEDEEHMYAGFMAAAISGLAARPGKHDPKELARDARAIGKSATDEFFAEMDAMRDPKRQP